MKHLLIVVASVLVMGLQSVADARPIDFSNRFIPFAVNASSVLTGTLENRFVPGGAALQVQPSLTSETALLSYGLLIPGQSEETTVTINGRIVSQIPLQRTDGKTYMIDPVYLSDGNNIIRIDKSSSEPWSGMVMFSLTNTFEEAHFGQAFGDWRPQSEAAVRDIQPSALQTNYDVLWYDCTWKPSMTSAQLLNGTEVTMGARALTTLQSIELDFDKNVNGGVPAMTVNYIDSGVGTPALSNSYDNGNYRLTVNFPAPIPAGTDFKIRIGYQGTPNPNVLGISSTKAYYRTTLGNNGRPLVFSNSQPYHARRWWPCKDHPSDKATTTVQKVIVPKPAGYTLTAISNGSLETTTDLGTDLMYVWRNDFPIATYLISIAVSDYTYTGGIYTSQDNSKTMPVGHFMHSDQLATEGTGFSGTLLAMNFFASKFGEYPFIDQKYQTATWGLTYGVEHQTNTSMPVGSVSSTGFHRRNVHELAHQWFGDKVTCESWDHVWLNEGFATYCEALFEEFRLGRAAYHNLVNSWSPSSSPVVSSAGDTFPFNTVYTRGAWVLHMLRHVVGDEEFFAGCKNYLSKGYTTALSQPGDGGNIDFQSSMEEGAGLSAGSLAQFFNQWLYSPNTNYESRPNFSFSAAYKSATNSSEIRIGQHQDLNNFQMPVDVRFTDADDNTTTVRVNTAVSGTTVQTVPLGEFVPVVAALDPDRWILKSTRAHINTSSLPEAVTGVAYSASLIAQPSSGNTWSKVAGASWINISSNGTVSGVPPIAGIYNVTVSVSNSVSSQQATFEIMAEDGVPLPPVVINEVLSENSESSPDINEFVELLNMAQDAVNIGGWQLVVVSSGGNALSSVTIPGGTVLPPNGLYVIGNASVINAVFPGAVDQNIAWSDSLPDSGGCVLKNELGQRVDSIAWRADRSFGSGSESGLIAAEGGTGRTLSFNMSSTDRNVSLGRLPNGIDTNVNLLDFAIIPPSPGAANAGIILPFEDDFNSGVKADWKPSFQDPARTATPGTAGKPTVAAPSPAGGNVLEVFDSTGGGDVVFLPGSFNQLSVEGFLWIPEANAAPWSVGIGVGTRVESGWFSSTAGFGLEHGLYLEFQNGSGIELKNNRVADSPNQARLIAANSLGAPGLSFSGFSAANLGVSVSLPQGTWQQFRVYFSVPQNRVFARIGDIVLYDGVLPAALNNLSGGVTVGFREEHSGNPLAANREGTFVDSIKVTSTTAPDAGVEDYELY